MDSIKYRYPLVEVIWDDPQGTSGWQAPPKELKPTPMLSVGFLVKKTDKHTMLAACYETGDVDISSTDTIPVGTIISMKQLKVSYGKKI